MRVDEVLPLGDYWRDPRFRAKRPGGTAPPDNFYRAGRGGSLVRVGNALHGPELAAQDISERHALVSWHFWYFGDQSPELPTELVHLIHSGQGHSLHANRRGDDLHTLHAWLAHWPAGLHCTPIDAKQFREPTICGRRDDFLQRALLPALAALSHARARGFAGYIECIASRFEAIDWSPSETNR